MSSNNSAVFGICGTVQAAGTAVDRLLFGGFSASAISVLLRNTEAARALVYETKTIAAEGATDISSSGVACWGFARLTGLAELEIPDAGMFLAAGPILAAVGSAMAGGSTESLAGTFIRMGVPEFEAKLFEDTVKDEGTLLSVHCEDSRQVRAAKRALEDTGARDVASTLEAVMDESAGGRTEAFSLSAEEAQEPSEGFMASRGSPQQPLKFKPDPAIS